MNFGALVNRVILFCMARAAALHGIRIHAICVLANRFHIIPAELRAFWQAYKLALDRWLSGKRTVPFPACTYLMRRKHRVQCRPFSAAGAWAVPAA